jgi:hypothetical protein
LIEKAWAKVNGSYDNIDGGFAAESLHDFTGAPVKCYRIEYIEDKPAKLEEMWNGILEGEL